MRSGRTLGVITAFVGLAAVVLLTAVFGSAPARTASRVESASPLQPAVTPDKPRSIARALRREQRKGTQEAEVELPADAKARCDRANSTTWFSTSNARLMYLDPSEDPESTGASRNRAAGCLYATGDTTEFGFSDMIDGSTFGQVTSAGDFTAFVASAWQASEDAVDSVEVWNLRAGSRTYRDPCSTPDSDCRVHDIAVSEAGSLAYVACLDRYCVLKARLAGSRIGKVFARLPVPRSRSRAILISEDRLYWLSARGRLRSIAFP